MRGSNPIVDYDRELTAGLRAMINYNDAGKSGVIRASSLGGCLLHDAYLAATSSEPDEEAEDKIEEIASGLPAYLGKAFEESITRDIIQSRWRGVTHVAPPGDEQWSVTGEAYGLPNLKGHLDGVVEEGGVRKSLEIKLMNPWRYRKFVRGEMGTKKRATAPGLINFPVYRTQVQCYAGLIEAPETIFVVGCSYAGQIKEDIHDSIVVVRVPFDASEFARALSRAEDLQTHLDNGTLPTCSNEEYCDYRKRDYPLLGARA